MSANGDNSKGRAIFREDFLPLLRSAGLGDYESIMASSGRDLVKAGLVGRKRTVLPLTGADGQVRTFYLKRYASSAPAEREWRAVEAVRAAGVPTMEPVAWGAGRQGGFVLVTAVPGEALSRCMDGWLARHADAAESAALAGGLGHLAGLLHLAGLAHRDFYTTHIFLHERGPTNDLYLIDLARVFRPRWRRWRWRCKDLAQLCYSLPEGWAQRHWPRVISAYVETLGEAIPARVNWAIGLRVRRMRRHDRRRLERRAAGER